jgi:hypothetical protein
VIDNRSGASDARLQYTAFSLNRRWTPKHSEDSGMAEETTQAGRALRDKSKSLAKIFAEFRTGSDAPARTRTA